MVVFGSKPKKPNSLKPQDFKTIENLEARRLKKKTTHCLSPLQYVAGSNRRIHHGISRARNAIFAASKAKFACGIDDTDFIAAFDWLVLSWVWRVLAKKGFDG